MHVNKTEQASLFLLNSIVEGLAHHMVYISIWNYNNKPEMAHSVDDNHDNIA